MLRIAEEMPSPGPRQCQNCGSLMKWHGFIGMYACWCGDSYAPFDPIPLPDEAFMEIEIEPQDQQPAARRYPSSESDVEV